MASSGALGIRAFKTTGEVLEFRAGPNNELICSADLTRTPNTFGPLSLIAFYERDAKFPHLVFPCDSSTSQIVYNPPIPSGPGQPANAPIYTLTIDLICPLLRALGGPPALAVGRFQLVISRGMFTASRGVWFQQAWFYSTKSSQGDPQHSFDLSPNNPPPTPPADSLNLCKTSNKFAIYGANWNPTPDPFSSSFGLMQLIGSKGNGSFASVTPENFRQVVPAGTTACIATGLFLDRSLTDNGDPTFCPGYELSFKTPASASYSLISRSSSTPRGGQLASWGFADFPMFP